MKTLFSLRWYYYYFVAIIIYFLHFLHISFHFISLLFPRRFISSDYFFSSFTLLSFAASFRFFFRAGADWCRPDFFRLIFSQRFTFRRWFSRLIFCCRLISFRGGSAWLRVFFLIIDWLLIIDYLPVWFRFQSLLFFRLMPFCSLDVWVIFSSSFLRIDDISMWLFYFLLRYCDACWCWLFSLFHFIISFIDFDYWWCNISLIISMASIFSFIFFHFLIIFFSSPHFHFLRRSSVCFHYFISMFLRFHFRRRLPSRDEWWWVGFSFLDYFIIIIFEDIFTLSQTFIIISMTLLFKYFFFDDIIFIDIIKMQTLFSPRHFCWGAIMMEDICSFLTLFSKDIFFSPFLRLLISIFLVRPS